MSEDAIDAAVDAYVKAREYAKRVNATTPLPLYEAHVATYNEWKARGLLVEACVEAALTADKNNA